MELQDILRKRQSIRHYKDGDVPEAHIQEMVKAAGTAPSGENAQPWHFVCIKNRDLMNKISELIRRTNEEICKLMDEKDKEKANAFRKFTKNLTLFFLRAPVLVVVYTKIYYPTGYPETQFIGASKEFTDELLFLRSPSMQSFGASIENFVLKAVDLGYGTCWITSANYAAKGIEILLKEEIGFEKEGYFMGAMLSLGIPEDNPKSPNKKPLEEIYTFVK